MAEPKIVKAKIGPYPRPMPEGMFDPMPKVTATFDNGEEKDLFTFYPDELSFTEGEFVGLTESEAKARKQKKDANFLRS